MFEAYLRKLEEAFRTDPILGIYAKDGADARIINAIQQDGQVGIGALEENGKMALSRLCQLGLLRYGYYDTEGRVVSSETAFTLMFDYLKHRNAAAKDALGKILVYYRPVMKVSAADVLRAQNAGDVPRALLSAYVEAQRGGASIWLPEPDETVLVTNPDGGEWIGRFGGIRASETEVLFTIVDQDDNAFDLDIRAIERLDTEN